MVGGIADQVDQRLTDFIQNRAIQLDILTLHIESDLLPEVLGQVTHQAGKALEHFTHRRHPCRQHLGLHRRDQAGNALAHLEERRAARLQGEGAQSVLGDDQLSDLLHQHIQAAEVDPNLAAGGRCLP